MISADTDTIIWNDICRYGLFRMISAEIDSRLFRIYANTDSLVFLRKKTNAINYTGSLSFGTSY